MTLHSVVIQKLLSANAHLGRRSGLNHFKIYNDGQRNGLTVIDSEKTLICLRNAASFIAQLARDKHARFLFVNTNPLFDEIVEQMTKKIGLYRPRDSIIWKLGGFLTNRFSPKKFNPRKKKLLFGPVQPPHCLVLFDTEMKSSVLWEAEKLHIPVVALVDSSMPWDRYKRIAYPVPANDSVEFVYLFCNIITKTFLLEQKKLKASKGDSGKEVQEVEETKIEHEYEMLVVPYQSLAPASDDVAETKKFLDKLVVAKFNGTLGTTVGFSGPKSAIEVCNGMTSLDLIVNQIESLNSKYGCRISLLLINTVRTHDDTLKVLEKYSRSNIDILPFKQESLNEQSGEDRDLSNPTVVSLSLMKSGIADVLLSQGKEYVHVVYSDNVAATIDSKILNHLIQNKIEYCMEVTPTASYDLRNGMVNQGQEWFQFGEITHDPSLQPMEKFKFIDTGSLWVNLKAIKRLIDTDALNLKNLSSSKVEAAAGGDQILMQETAGLFERAIGINVPQCRFVPLNATSNLLLLQSDIYSSADGVLVRNTARASAVNPSIDLGPEFEKVSDYQSRFKSIPSIVGLDALKVVGDVWFGAGVTLKGRVSVVAKPGMKLEIPDGAVLENKEINDPADI